MTKVIPSDDSFFSLRIDIPQDVVEEDQGLKSALGRLGRRGSRGRAVKGILEACSTQTGLVITPLDRNE